MGCWPKPFLRKLRKTGSWQWCKPLIRKWAKRSVPKQQPGPGANLFPVPFFSLMKKSQIFNPQWKGYHSAAIVFIFGADLAMFPWWDAPRPRKRDTLLTEINLMNIQNKDYTVHHRGGAGRQKNDLRRNGRVNKCASWPSKGRQISPSNHAH